MINGVVFLHGDVQLCKNKADMVEKGYSPCIFETYETPFTAAKTHANKRHTSR